MTNDAFAPTNGPATAAVAENPLTVIRELRTAMVRAEEKRFLGFIRQRPLLRSAKAGRMASPARR